MIPTMQADITIPPRYCRAQFGKFILERHIDGLVQ